MGQLLLGKREKGNLNGARIYVSHDSPQSEPITFDKGTSGTFAISVFLFRVALSTPPVVVSPATLCQTRIYRVLPKEPKASSA